jgi:hypothetical protein
MKKVSDEDGRDWGRDRTRFAGGQAVSVHGKAEEAAAPGVARHQRPLSFIIPFPFSPHTAASLQIASAASSLTGIPSLVLFQPPHLSPSPAPSPSLLFQHVQRLTYLQAFYICMYIGRSLLTSGSLGSEFNRVSATMVSHTWP